MNTLEVDLVTLRSVARWYEGVKRKPWLPFLVLVQLLTGCKSAEDYVWEADRLSEQGKYHEAIVLLDKAIAKNPQLVSAYINRGADKSATGQFLEAIRDYQSAVAIEADNTLALFNIGNNYKRLDSFETAIGYYDKAMATKGDGIYVDWHPNRFVNPDPSDVPGYEIIFERAIAHYYNDSIRLAYNDLKTALESGYMVADCYYWLGFVYLSYRDKILACESFQKSKVLGNTDALEEIKRYCR